MRRGLRLRAWPGRDRRSAAPGSRASHGSDPDPDGSSPTGSSSTVPPSPRSSSGRGSPSGGDRRPRRRRGRRRGRGRCGWRWRGRRRAASGSASSDRGPNESGWPASQATSAIAATAARSHRRGERAATPPGRAAACRELAPGRAARAVAGGAVRSAASRAPLSGRLHFHVNPVIWAPFPPSGSGRHPCQQLAESAPRFGGNGFTPAGRRSSGSWRMNRAHPARSSSAEASPG